MTVIELRRRRKLLELIHEFEAEHQTLCEILGFYPFRTPKWERPESSSERVFEVERGIAVASAAYNMRRILKRFDRHESH